MGLIATPSVRTRSIGFGFGVYDPDVLDIDATDDLDEVAEGQARRIDSGVGDDLGQGNGTDGTEPDRTAGTEETERVGDDLQVRRDSGALIERRNWPALLACDLFEPGFMRSPFFPPRQFFATASTAALVSAAWKSSISLARSITNSAKSLILSAALAFSVE